MYVKQRRNSVCYNCPDRNVGCHSNCGKYQEEVNVNLKNYDERVKQLELGNALKDSKERRIKSKVYQGKYCHKK